MGIGESIKYIRIQKKMTQKELGEKLGGIPQQQIGRWENGKSNPKLDTIQKIATALQVDINTLLGHAYLDESPLYRAAKRKGDTESELFLDYKNHLLAKGIDWQAIDIEMIKRFNTLNEMGQSKALNYVEDISKLPEYQKKNIPNEDK